jgi:hypothetical protein
MFLKIPVVTQQKRSESDPYQNLIVQEHCKFIEPILTFEHKKICTGTGAFRILSTSSAEAMAAGAWKRCCKKC